MKKLINAPERVVEEMLRGMGLAHPELVRIIPEYGVVVRADAPVEGKVALVYVVKNYTGDVLNFEMAGELAEAEEIETDYVVTNDDVAVEDSTFTSGRRGVAGTVFVHKISGAAADDGRGLGKIKELAEKVNA